MVPINITSETLFVVNHSGGKDSQATYLLLRNLCREGVIKNEQLIVVHADLGEVDWDGILDHITATVDPVHQLFVTKSKRTFFDMVLQRRMFPSPSTRQCTSDLKRNPIQTTIRQYCTAHGFTTVVNVMGLRANESTGRAKKAVWSRNKTQSNSKREWFEWLPIHNWWIPSEVGVAGKVIDPTGKNVFQYIADNGQKPFWTYSKGMERVSCVVCIMASDNDIMVAHQLAPEKFQKYIDVEAEIGYAMMMPKGGKVRFLPEVLRDACKNCGCHGDCNA